MQLFFHGFNLLFVSSFESEDRGPMQSFTLGLARILKISVVLNCSPVLSFLNESFFFRNSRLKIYSGP